VKSASIYRFPSKPSHLLVLSGIASLHLPVQGLPAVFLNCVDQFYMTEVLGFHQCVICDNNSPYTAFNKKFYQQFDRICRCCSCIARRLRCADIGFYQYKRLIRTFLQKVGQAAKNLKSGSKGGAVYTLNFYNQGLLSTLSRLNPGSLVLYPANSVAELTFKNCLLSILHITYEYIELM